MTADELPPAADRGHDAARVDFIALLRSATEAVQRYADAVPEFDLMATLQEQLAIVQAVVVAGRVPTGDERNSINIGVLAMRELSDFDPELANQLMEIDYRFKRLHVD